MISSLGRDDSATCRFTRRSGLNRLHERGGLLGCDLPLGAVALRWMLRDDQEP
jgi:hypothetical protein